MPGYQQSLSPVDLPCVLPEQHLHHHNVIGPVISQYIKQVLRTERKTCLIKLLIGARILQENILW